MASNAYSEHVGEKRQAAGNHGETIILYARSTFKAMTFIMAAIILVPQEGQSVVCANLRSSHRLSRTFWD
jgi:hypothetical protein